MKKFFLIGFILVVLLVLGLFFSFNFLNKKDTKIKISEIKLVSGFFTEYNNGEVILDVEEKIDDLSSNSVKKSFSLYNNTLVEKVTDEIKAEEVFRKEERAYKDWKDNLKEEIEVASYLETPAWNVREKINLDDLKKGDKIRALYFTDRKEEIIFRIIVEEEDYESKVFEVSKGKNDVKIFGVIKSFNENFLTVDINSSQPNIFSEFPKRLSLIVDSDTSVFKKEKKTEEQFREEEREYKEKIKQMKEAGQDTINVAAPSWFADKAASISILQNNLSFEAMVNMSGETAVVQQIKILD